MQIGHWPVEMVGADRNAEILEFLKGRNHGREAKIAGAQFSQQAMKERLGCGTNYRKHARVVDLLSPRQSLWTSRRQLRAAGFQRLKHLGFLCFSGFDAEVGRSVS